MAVVISTGFDTGDSIACAQVNGTFSLVSSPVHSPDGGYAVRTNPATTATGAVALRGVLATSGAFVSGVSGVGAHYIRFYFRVATLPSANNEQIFSCLTDVGATAFNLRIGSDGKLSAYNNTTQLGSTGATALSVDTWYRIDIKVVSGAWEVRINASSEISGSDAFTTTSVTPWLGKRTNRNGNTVDFYYDDVCIDGAAYPPDGQGKLLVPNANGTHQSWSIGAGSGSHYEVVDEAPHNSDTDYLASTDVVGDAETEAFSCSISAASIAAVLAIGVVKRDGATNGTVRNRLRSSTTNADTSNDASTTSAYAFCGQLRTTDPATSAAWTVSGLDGTEFGFIERDATNRTRCTFVGLEVDYVAAAPVAGNPWYYYAQQ